MLLVVAALHQEAAELLRVLQREAVRVLERAASSAHFSNDITKPTHTRPTFALFEMPVCGHRVRIGVLITGVGKVASSYAVSAACTLYTPRALVSIGCALDLARGTARSTGEPVQYAIACVATAVQHDVNCLHMPRVKSKTNSLQAAYKKRTYGEFVHASTVRHTDTRLYSAVLSAAHQSARIHAVALYENAAMLSGDMFVPHRKSSLIPESVRVLGFSMADHYDMLLLDMETAAVFYAASAFAVPFMACAVVLDSVADSSPIAFSRVMPRLSCILCDVLIKTLAQQSVLELFIK